MQIEKQLGFRSSFNFIPEGEYRVPRDLREELRGDGFEVGVHDLRHDGKLFVSQGEFRKHAERINHYLQDWGAVGFRAGFMLRNLEWLHHLNIQYDASTFDTDPFEPQPQGRHTIFPFWVPNPRGQKYEDGSPSATSHWPASAPHLRHGYVELPYTLPQDSTLFRLFRERHPDIWFQKLDWIARHGGMVLLDTHPDYMAMNGNAPQAGEYPVSHYRRFLEHVRSHYAGAYWHGLPEEVVGLVRKFEEKRCAPDSARPLRVRPAEHRPKIWIDLDNTPHVPFFEPILEELKARGFPVLVTARDAFQVCELAERKGMAHIKVGRHHGRNPVRKLSGLLYRALQLAPVVWREKPALAVSHGSRAQLILCNLAGLPSILIDDYEYSRYLPLMRPDWTLLPEAIPAASVGGGSDHVRRYPGVKEDIYVSRLQPDAAILAELGLAEGETVVTARPPATEAHYHARESERLFQHFMDRACRTAGVRVVMLPRNRKQEEAYRASCPHWFADGRTVIPKRAVDGLNLLWHSDLVVSGGGTMNREAAALGVPVYSVFRGPIGAVDQRLAKEGRLVLIESTEDADCKIALVNRPSLPEVKTTSNRALQQIVDGIEEIAYNCAD